MQVDESVTVKGTPVRSLQKFIENDLTEAQRQQVFAQLPPEYAARFHGPILPTETIPVHMLNVFTEAAAQAKGEKVEDFARRAGREAAGEAVRGVYRFFAMVLTPPALLAKAGQMWSALYNRGEMRVEEQTSTSARIRLVSFPSELAGCWRTTGWIERMAELTGAKDIKVEQTQCFAKGAPSCEWRLSWR
jgi:eukaryotic-like serine/threonine-protein kinase